MRLPVLLEPLVRTFSLAFVMFVVVFAVDGGRKAPDSL